MICKKCGNKIEDDSPFCYFCGEVFTEEDSDNSGWDKIDNNEKRINEISDLDLPAESRNLILTTASVVEGHPIIKYNGIVSGTGVVGTGMISEFKAGVADFFGTDSDSFSNRVEDAKLIAINQMIREALKKQSNAIIGIKIDVTVTSNNMFICSMVGTSVNIS